jgi:nucleotide-binding universal stress UspA family protein
MVAPVVVGADGSASSRSAVRLAARHACAYGCPLHIVHAFNWLPRQPELIDDRPGGARPGVTANELIQDAVTAAHQAAPGVVIATRLLEGAATSTLLRQARTAALVAVGGGGLPKQVCLPTHSSAVHVAARAPCSVLVARTASRGGGPIIVGVNGSSASEQALDFAFDTAARRRMELVVVRPSSVRAAGSPTGVCSARWRRPCCTTARHQSSWYAA